MTEKSIDVPDSVPGDVADRVRKAVSALEELTIEKRVYALSESELPADVDVFRDRDDLPYYVDGEQPMFDEIVVAPNGENLEIAVQWSSRRGHWKEHDYAGDVWDVMEQYGIEKPHPEERGGEELEERYYKYGVKFGSDGSIAVVNAVLDVVEVGA